MGWINVRDQLPEDGQTVRVRTTGDRWWREGGITHWKPLRLGPQKECGDQLIGKCANCESWERTDTNWAGGEKSHDYGLCTYWRPPKDERREMYVLDTRLKTRDDSPGCGAFNRRDGDPDEDRRVFTVIQRESPLSGKPYALVYDDGVDFRYLDYATRPDGPRKIAAFLNARLKLRAKDRKA